MMRRTLPLLMILALLLTGLPVAVAEETGMIGDAVADTNVEEDPFANPAGAVTYDENGIALNANGVPAVAVGIYNTQAEWVGQFNYGYAPFMSGGLYGVLRYDGTQAISAQYVSVGEYSEGYFAAQRETGWDYYNINGDMVVSGPFELASPFHGGAAVVTQNNVYAIIGKDGVITVQPGTWDYIEPFICAVTFARKGEEWSIIRNNGEVISTKPYAEVSLASDGYALLARAGQEYDVFDRYGSIVLTITADEIGELTSRHVTYRQGDKYLVYDFHGNEILSLPAEKIEPQTATSYTGANVAETGANAPASAETGAEVATDVASTRTRGREGASRGAVSYSKPETATQTSGSTDAAVTTATALPAASKAPASTTATAQPAATAGSSISTVDAATAAQLDALAGKSGVYSSDRQRGDAGNRTAPTTGDVTSAPATGEATPAPTTGNASSPAIGEGASVATTDDAASAQLAALLENAGGHTSDRLQGTADGRTAPETGIKMVRIGEKLLAPKDGIVMLQGVDKNELYKIETGTWMGDDTWLSARQPNNGVIAVQYADGWGYADLEGNPKGTDHFKLASDYHYYVSTGLMGDIWLAFDASVAPIGYVEGVVDESFGETGFRHGYILSNNGTYMDIIYVAGSELEKGEFTRDGGTLSGYSGEGGYVIVPDGVDTLLAGTFAGNKRITGISLPDSLLVLEDGAFAGCSNMTGVVNLSANTAYVGARAFEGTKVTGFSVPASDRATYYSDKGVLYLIDGTLTAYPQISPDVAYVLPEKVSSIGGYAFAGVTGLEYLEIPASIADVLYVTDDAFKGATGLTVICPKGSAVADSVLAQGVPVMLDGSELVTPSPESLVTEDPFGTPVPQPTPTPTSGGGGGGGGGNPTAKPTVKPTTKPTAAPTNRPTATPRVTTRPTATPKPTTRPTATVKPTTKPTATPTSKPTVRPTEEPTEAPTPTLPPTPKPTPLPTTVPTMVPPPTPEPTMPPMSGPTSVPGVIVTPEPPSEEVTAPPSPEATSIVVEENSGGDEVPLDALANEPELIEEQA